MFALMGNGKPPAAVGTAAVVGVLTYFKKKGSKGLSAIAQITPHRCLHFHGIRGRTRIGV